MVMGALSEYHLGTIRTPRLVPGWLQDELDGSRPLILKRLDEDFAEAFLGEVALPPGQSPLLRDRTWSWRREDRAKGRDEGLLLYQPIHQVFYLTAIEVVCEPRPDLPHARRHIESAGFVIRKVLPPPEPTKGGLPLLRGRLAKLDRRPVESRYQGWVRKGEELLGWRTLDGAQVTWEPEAGRRVEALAAGDRTIDLPVDPSELWTEATFSLFPAEVEGHTVFYGYVPVASGERAPKPLLRSVLRERAAELHPACLKAGFSPGRSTAWKGELGALLCSRQLGLFVSETAATRRLRGLLAASGALDRVPVAGSGVEAQYEPEDPGEVPLPRAVPAVDAAREGQIAAAIEAVLEERTRESLGELEEKFADPEARYVLFPFIRCHRPTCPPKVVWGEPSEPFAIAPWYQHSGAPPRTVQLPDVTKEMLKALKPQVAFKMPRSIAKWATASDLGRVFDGEEPSSQEAGETACSFSIPIVTICAMILLLIIVYLLDRLFFWVPFIWRCFRVK